MLWPLAASSQVSLFQNLTTRDGLPSNYIFDAVEDEEGFLWLGTDKGLARYDGFRWQLHNTDHGLPGNYITKVMKAGKKGLWLTVSSKGLYYYDISSGKVSFLTDKGLDHYLQTDKEGNLFYYRREDRSPSVYSYCWVNPSSLNTVVVFTTSPLQETGYLDLADFPERKIIFIPLEGMKQQKIPETVIDKNWKTAVLPAVLDETDLLRKVSAEIYVSRSRIYYLPRGKQVRSIQLFSNENPYLNFLPYNSELVIWNEKDGLYFVHPDGAIRHFTDKDGLGSNMVTNVYRLKNGQLLICTLGGGLSYKLPDGNALLHTGNQPVKGLTQKNNLVYAALDRQLLKFDFTNYSTQRFELEEKSVQGADALNDALYISSLSGISVYKEAGLTLKKINFIPVGAGVSNLILSGNRILAGTFGVHVIEWKDNVVRFDTTTPFVSERITPFSKGYISYNYEDGLQLIYDDGQRISLTVKEGLPSNAIYHVHEYKDSFWISTKKGVAVYTGGKIVQTIGPAEGLLGNRAIFSFHDPAGVCWILTDTYLGKIAANKVITFVSLPVKSGLNDYVHTAVYNTKLNTLVTGTLKQVYLNKLDNIPQPSAAEPPRLQGISLDGVAITDTLFSIPLQYSRLSFSFSPYQLNPFGKSTVYYRLAGHEEQFSELKDSLTVHFSKLRSGKYTLIGKVVNEDGVESAEIILCRFTVTKPFWQTAGFISLLILGSMTAAYFIATAVQQRKQRQKEKERKLEQQLINERERISRELHDNLGSSLVTIIAQSDNIETKLLYKQPEEALKKVQELGDQSRETMNILRETIWAVQEESHTYDSFVNRIRDYLQRTYSVTNTNWRVEVNGTLQKNLSPEQTLNLFRCIQECTQNIIKHSGAMQAVYVFTAAGNGLKIDIQDDGKGFDTGKSYTSHGIRNIRARMQELNGQCTIQSGSGTGTFITIQTDLSYEG